METTHIRIKEVLNNKGIKQIWFADKLEKSQKTVNMYVNNELQQPIPVLYEIAKILEVEPSDLLKPSSTLTSN